MNTIHNDKKIIEQIPKKPLKFALYVARKHFWFGVGAFSSQIIASTASHSYPYVFGKLIDAATTAEVRAVEGTIDYSSVAIWISILIGIMAVWHAGYRVSGFFGMQWITRLNATGHDILFKYLSLHSHGYFANRFAGAVTNKAGNIVHASRRFAENFLWNYTSMIIAFSVSTFLVFRTNILIGTAYVSFVVVLLTMNYFMMRYRKKFVVNYAKQRSELRGQAVDAVGNMTAVRQFARRAYELMRLGKQINKERVADVRDWLVLETTLTLNSIFVVSSVGGMFVLSFMLLSDGTITLGEFVMTITLMFNIMGTLMFIGNAMSEFTRNYGDSEEGLKEIVVPHEILDESESQELVVPRGELIFKNVNFTYEEGFDPVFKDLSFTISPGEKVGIVGSSGAGKTTLVSLLLRQQDINDGAILIDGTDIKMVTQDSLRGHISLIPQDPLLFHRSIMENIRYGDLEATDEKVKEAARLAQAHEFIEAAPDGYETLVGERGIKLSGGQRQRVAIARAMLKNSPILILDEATSALDSESEVRVQQALHELVKGKTVLAIAHRLSTLREMDRIIVLDKGNIAQDGSHEELLKETSGVYATLWTHQAGGFIQDEE